MNAIQAEKNFSLYLEILQRNSWWKGKAAKQFGFWFTIGQNDSSEEKNLAGNTSI